jgi:hypothetical protein
VGINRAYVDQRGTFPSTGKPWYISPTTQAAATTTDMGLEGAIRITAKLRLEVTPGSSDEFICGQWNGLTASASWFWGARTTGLIFGIYDETNPGVRRDLVAMSSAELAAALPQDVDSYIGTEVVPNHNGTQFRAAGLTSLDGEHWTYVRNVIGPTDFRPRNNNSIPLNIGSHQTLGTFSPSTWRPAANSTIASKYLGGGNQRGYAFTLAAAGTLVFTISTTGGNFFQALSSVAVPAGNTPLWVKFTSDRTTGATNFYTAPDGPNEPTSWNLLGTEQTLQAGTSIFASSAPFEIGTIDNGTQPFAGAIRRVLLRSGIAGTTVLDVHENDAAHLVTPSTFSAGTGQTVTVNQTGSNLIIQPQADRVMWRYDSDEGFEGGSWTDPRGVTWTLTDPLLGQGELFAQPTTLNTNLFDITNDRVILWVEIGGTATTITIERAGTDRFGNAVPDIVLSSVTNTKRAFRLTSDMVNPATGAVKISFSQLTGVKAVVLDG